MTTDEINAFLADTDKFLAGEFEWRRPNGRFQFRQAVQYDNSANRKIELSIWCNLDAPTMTIAYFVSGIGRIYGFCLGVSHGNMLYHRHYGVGESAIVTPLPDSIARPVDNPAEVWERFCAETSLTHVGDFRNPPEEPWLPQATEI